MKKALSLLFAVVVYCSFAAMPVLAGESIFYDGSDTGMLQTIDGSANSLAPSGSSTGKSNSLSGNSITVSSNVSGRVYGAINTKDLEIVTGNSVVINTGTVGSYVYGGYSSSGSVTNNSITVNGGVNSIMYAGYSDGDSNSTGNILTINNGTVSFIIAGRAYNGNAIGNMVIINGDTVANDYVLGGYSNGSGNATGNSVIINSGTVSNYYYIAGGYIDLGATGNATENSVAINGGTINSNVAGGMAYTGSATNNIVTISGNPVFGASIGIYGGARSSGSGDIFTGNTLNVYNYKGSSFGRVQNFEYYNFVFPVDQSGPVLSVSTATLGDGAGKSSVVTAGTLDGKNRLTVGATRILIEADYLDDTDFTQAQAEGMHGAFFRYLWELDTAFNRLTAKLLSVDIIAQTKILSEGAAAGAILAGQGADNINGGLLSGLQEGKAEVIASIFGGSSKYDTGSSVEMNVFGIAAGIAKKFTSTSAGIFAEYADASFDTEYNGSTGDGKATATGIGVLVKKDMQEGAYVEGLIRAGQLSNDYKTKIDDGLGTTADFDYSTTYFGLSLGVGQILKINEKINIDAYGKYALTSVGKSDADLTTGEKYKIDPTLSNRIKAGAKGEYKMSETIKPYLSLAYDYELSGDVNAKIDGYEIEAPSLNGGTFSGGLGLNAKVAEKLTLDLSANVYSGVREGVIGNLQVKYQF